MTDPRPVLMFTDLPGRPPGQVVDPDDVREVAGAGKRPDHPLLRQVVGPTGDDDMPGRWVAV